MSVSGKIITIMFFLYYCNNVSLWDMVCFSMCKILHTENYNAPYLIRLPLTHYDYNPTYKKLCLCRYGIFFCITLTPPLKVYTSINTASVYTCKLLLSFVSKGGARVWWGCSHSNTNPHPLTYHPHTQHHSLITGVCPCNILRISAVYREWCCVWGW